MSRRWKEPHRHLFYRQLTLVFALLFGVSFASCENGKADNTKPKKEIKEHRRFSDGEIRDAIRRTVWEDEAVSAQGIKFSVVKGIVTLKGRVDNLREAYRAKEIAENIMGVRSIIDEIVVFPAAVPDPQLQHDVEQALRSDPATDSYKIVDTVKEGVVSLSGNVTSWAASSLAETVVSCVRGVKKIRNLIQTLPSDTRPESEIKGDVIGRLAADALVRDNLITVDVFGKVVMLSGYVSSAAERLRASHDAWVFGVEKVDDSQLKVALWDQDEFRRTDYRYASVSDEQIKKAIYDAFRYDPRVWEFDIGVDVKDGIVELGGVVDNLATRMAAEEDANNTLGVWRVLNYLAVKPEEAVPNEVLAERVGLAIKRDPYLHLADVKATVERGTVDLLGNVESKFEKQHATETISRVAGVVELKNMLMVHKSYARKGDWEIRLDVAENLTWSPYVDREKIRIRVDAGKVELKGVVANWRAYREALNAAYRAGAKSVRDSLMVEEGPSVLKAKV